MAELTLFQRIMAGQIPAQIQFEDDRCIVLHDINPQAPVHLLVIPREPITRLDEAEPRHTELLGHLLLVAQAAAAKAGLKNGYRVIINNGADGGESVPHLHVHLLGGRPLHWPPG